MSEKEVEETFVRESSELVHISVGNETITTTPEHPFYTIQKEFVKAIKLRAGDILCTVNGEYVVVEQIQHEILESPIKVYNFRVAENHTYYVGNTSVGVHNTTCAEKTTTDDNGNNDDDTIVPSEDSIDAFIKGNKSFADVVNDYAKLYADTVNKNVKWSWDKSIKGGENLDKTQRGLIRQRAVENGYLPDVKVAKVKGMKYGFADFRSAGVVKKILSLPEEMWKLSDSVQFKWLNEQIGGKIDGYTWHHSEIPGQMELVPYGIHNITPHNGGRSPGMWADAPR